MRRKMAGKYMMGCMLCAALAGCGNADVPQENADALQENVGVSQENAESAEKAGRADAETDADAVAEKDAKEAEGEPDGTEKEDEKSVPEASEKEREEADRQAQEKAKEQEEAADEEEEPEVGTGITADTWEEAYDLMEQKRKGDVEWRRADVNGDGIPDLIPVVEEEYRYHPVDIIYTFQEGEVVPVYEDYADMTEYLYLCDNDNLIYTDSMFGTVGFGTFWHCRFTEDWKKVCCGTLDLNYFDDAQYQAEGTSDMYKEEYPDTYGAYGGGLYCYRGYPEGHPEEDEWVLSTEVNREHWVRELIPLEEFLERYKAMSGRDFVTENPDWEYEVKTELEK